jgi:hypothetical protein
MSKPKNFLKAAFAAALTTTALAGCAIVPVGPTTCYPNGVCTTPTVVEPVVVVAPAPVFVPAPIYVAPRPWYGNHWHRWH